MSSLEEHFARLREIEAREGRSIAYDHAASLTMAAHLSELEQAVACWRDATAPKDQDHV
jgi:hypothetical protein